MMIKLYRSMRGVSLLELMVVVVIIGIMAALSYPSYRNFVDRAKRNEAKAILLEIAQNQERFYLQNSRYGTLGELGYGNPLMTDTGAYAVTLPNPPNANNFTATATYQLAGPEAGKCAWFSIDGRGTKTSGDGFTDCWTRTR